MKTLAELRQQFDTWAESKTGTLFSPGAKSSDFYFAVWIAGYSQAEAELLPPAGKEGA